MKRITIKFMNHHNACDEAKEWFNSLKQDSYSVNYLVKLLFKEDHFDWIDWGIVRLMNKKQQVAYTIFAAEQVIKLFTDKYPNDNRPQEAINAAKKCLSNPCKATKKAARITAKDCFAAAAAAAYYSAARAAYAAADAAGTAAARAAYAAAYAADAAAARAAYARAVATNAAAAYAADAAAAERTLQRKIINYGLKLIA